jgi:ATP-dependent Clp protease protease subunit
MQAQRLVSLLLLACPATVLSQAAANANGSPSPAPAPAVAAAEVQEETTPPDPLQPLRDEIAKTNLEKERIASEVALAQAKLDQELADTKMSTARLTAQLAELKAKQDLADYQQKLAQDKELASMKRRFEKATLEMNLAKAIADRESSEIRSVENTTKKDTARMIADMELENKQAEFRNYVLNDPVYLKEPMQGKKLILSDRRIPLNGPIGMNTADTITARINYFNNRDRESPIFIVIDDSPGGSVMAGYKILKAMHGSQAPVYVVVKSMAASMAACITTLAERSYAYPNAVILHHQISSISGGNLTQQQEWMKEMQEWWKRLADPVAAKMGLTREEFIKQMYANRSTGDWNLFADEAQKLKWVDQIVEEIEETGTVKNPDIAPPQSTTPVRIPLPLTGAGGQVISQAQASVDGQTLMEQRDEKGRPFVVLPRLNPMDCYWMYNPDGYFRAQ